MSVAHDAQLHHQPALAVLRGLVHRVVLGDPPGARRERDGHLDVIVGGLEDAFGEVARRDVGVQVDGRVERLDRRDPVEPEEPLVLGLVTPGVEIVVAVMARTIFEALQRHRRIHHSALPTALVLEEAHTFVRFHASGGEDYPTPGEMCVRSFERIARTTLIRVVLCWHQMV